MAALSGMAIERNTAISSRNESSEHRADHPGQAGRQVGDGVDRPGRLAAHVGLHARAGRGRGDHVRRAGVCTSACGLRRPGATVVG